MQGVEGKPRSNQLLLTTPIPWDPCAPLAALGPRGRGCRLRVPPLPREPVPWRRGPKRRWDPDVPASSSVLMFGRELARTLLLRMPRHSGAVSAGSCTLKIVAFKKQDHRVHLQILRTSGCPSRSSGHRDVQESGSARIALGAPGGPPRGPLGTSPGRPRRIHTRGTQGESGKGGRGSRSQHHDGPPGSTSRGATQSDIGLSRLRDHTRLYCTTLHYIMTILLHHNTIYYNNILWFTILQYTMLAPTPGRPPARRSRSLPPLRPRRRHPRQERGRKTSCSLVGSIRALHQCLFSGD